MIEAGAGASVRGTEMFAMAMNHFGKNVRGVKGIWKYGDNLDEVNRLVESGVPLAEAVQRTWTARRAASFGFTQATVREAKKGPNGRFTSVVVAFE